MSGFKNKTTGGGGGAVNQVTAADTSLTITPTTGNVTAKISQQGASSNQVLAWNGTNWAPATTANSVSAADSTLTITPTTGNVTAKISQQGASSNQVLAWNGTAWAPATINVATIPSAYLYSAITADPNPAVVGTYYHAAYPSSGNLTLPVAPTTGSWVGCKNRSTTTTITFVGTVDGGTANTFTLTPGKAVLLVYNGTDWDAN